MNLGFACCTLCKISERQSPTMSADLKNVPLGSVPPGSLPASVPTTSDQGAVDQGTIDAHRLLVMWLFVATMLVSIGLMWTMLSFFRSDGENQQSRSFLLMVVAAGALGGFVSSLRRLYGFQDIFPRKTYVRLFRRTSLYVIAYSFVPPLVGGIGAAVLYLVFAGSLLEGGLFPRFDCVGGATCTTFYAFVTKWAPKTPGDYAKALVWGFIAAFSERFVPDILNRMSRPDDAEHPGGSGLQGRA